jgi:hypothetical protein
MDTKATLAAIVVVVVLIIGFFLLRPTSTSTPVNAPAQNSTASSTPQTSESATSTNPQSTTGTGAIKVSADSIALFSASSFTSTSTYPTVTGIANTSKVGIIIDNSKGVGLVGTASIPVVGAVWSYSSPVALTPGTYTLVLFVGKTITQTASLTVR